ncbi:seryl-tRNA synthetase [Beutenbergia cavernae DSM 12333]|uniref:Serine--tRNA ligase n=1 Tax=Beutenbergia cavernae (strain ATCC BAA-8 / DSM 12333 / CCUG 43141 / JCM 11478 / NBRC 16432 / NCIMB 13614 / HKI 0122) TaxID=471853 RepID=SYS_BEUC1|nr:serine--tRNA ligase [Beutenbergia cavernae]C5BWI5.1 RecName: Full=Serine--tRNA ligase; AltName: Full=Seryl-tRNA synthetase; Short=SerRS; AltName: Full=Seryl-tRNA(Ser/Sec) synthetase [Beutenbergia cavernae DSM 12333]ACQ78643.1 seryl-tRNA synthetase [Beutenbergia cavernae DSM 12333]
MIDLKALRENPDVGRASQRSRGEDPELVDRLLDADARHRALLTSFEQQRAEQKELSRAVGKAAPQDRPAVLAHAKSRAEQVKSAEADADRARAELDALLSRMPNIVADGVPPGGEDDYVVLRHEGTPRDFAAEGFTPRDHLELGERLRAIDTERGAKVSGARFFYLTGLGARLELALLNAAIDKALTAGFTPVITPTLVKPEIMAGTGFLGAHAEEVYRIEKDDLYLVGTSEVALAGYHANEIVDLSDGPLRYAGWSACYRREAGSHGKDTRGIIRVHQFHKVEMFSYARLEDAAVEHERLLAWEEELLRLVELPYRVIDTAAGDLGSSAARKFDCEAWLPTQERYLELTSTSNCTSFQARRLGTRERLEDGSTRPVATLNGTLATTRWIVTILENHQNPDGSVRVPAGLQPYLGGLTELRAS